MAEIITLDMNHPAVHYLCQKDKRLARVISMVGSITYEPHDDGYAFLIHEIIEQMLSVKAGAKIYSRLVNACNGRVSPEVVSRLSAKQIKAVGTSQNKVSCIRALTDAIMNGQLSLDGFQSMTDKEVMRALTQIKGIGNWTAKMYLIFILNRPDVLPYEDAAFLQSYKWVYKTDDVSKESVEKKCQKWKPYASIAARFMYRALDLGFTKEDFHLYK